MIYVKLKYDPCFVNSDHVYSIKWFVYAKEYLHISNKDFMQHIELFKQMRESHKLFKIYFRFYRKYYCF
jgi:hypothetical protein